MQKDDPISVRPNVSVVRRPTVSDQIRDLLRQRIVSLELEPGQSLSRSDLAMYYEVSQTPIRDAILQLESEGLLQVYPQARTIVSHIDVDHARETHFLRLALEVEVARALCMSHRPLPIETLHSIVNEMEQAAEMDDMLRFIVKDASFHRTMFAAVNKDNLWHLVIARSGHIDRLRRLNLPDPGKVERILISHRKILTSMEARDAGATEEALRTHLGETLSRVERIVADHAAFFKQRNY